MASVLCSRLIDFTCTDEVLSISLYNSEFEIFYSLYYFYTSHSYYELIVGEFTSWQVVQFTGLAILSATWELNYPSISLSSIWSKFRSSVPQTIGSQKSLQTDRDRIHTDTKDNIPVVNTRNNEDRKKLLSSQGMTMSHRNTIDKDSSYRQSRQSITRVAATEPLSAIREHKFDKNSSDIVARNAGHIRRDL